MRRLAALPLLALLAVTGCASETDTESAGSTAGPSARPSSEPSSNASVEPTSEPAAIEYATLEELRLALVSTGEPCDSLQVLGSDSQPYGICLPDHKWSVVVYPSAADVDAVVQQGDDSLEPGTFLVGTNWMIAVGATTPPEAAAPVQAALGGTIWESDEPFVR